MTETCIITIGELHGNRAALERWLDEEFAPAIREAARKARYENPDPDSDTPGPDGLRR